MVARKTSTQPTRIYSYGVRPQFHSPIIDDLLRRQVIYYNTLLELENLRRIWFNEFESSSSTDVASATKRVTDLEVQYELAKENIRREREATHKRSMKPELTASKDAILLQLKEARLIQKDTKARHREQYVAPREEMLRRIIAETYPVTLDELQALSGDDLQQRVKKLRADNSAPGPRTLERINADIIAQLLEETQWSDAWKQLQRCESLLLQTRKDARKISQLPHGTYVLAEMSLDAAKKMRKAGDLERKWVNGPGDLPITSSGRVGIQLQGGLSFVQLMDHTDPRLGLTTEPYPDGFENRSRNWKATNTRAWVRMKVNSESGSAPICVDIPIIYHRPLPPQCTIKWAWLLARREGRRIRYSVQFTIESPPEEVLAPPKSICAINLGWRHLDNGMLRVGYLVGSDGVHRDFCIPKCDIDRLDYPSELRSISDKHFDLARETTLRTVATMVQVPEWITQHLKNISKWKNHAKLHRFHQRLATDLSLDKDTLRNIWNQWKSEGRGIPTRDSAPDISLQARRAAPKKDLFDTFNEVQSFCRRRGISEEKHLSVYLHFWEMKDYHLEQWASDHRNKYAGRRNDQFRVWAHWINLNYETIVFEDDALTEAAKKAADDKEDPGSGFRKERSKAAPGYFKLAVVSKSGKTRVRIVPSFYNTQQCSLCLHVNEWDTKVSVVHTCGGCGKVHDQDRNNATNQLRIALEGSGGEAPSIDARSSSKSTRSSSRAAAE